LILTKDIPSVRIRKIQLWLEEFDLLLLDYMMENLPVRKMWVRLNSILK